MGKNGKLRKKRRLESVGDVAVLPGGAATAGRDSGAKAGAGTSAAATGTAAVAMVAGAVAKPDLDAAVRVLATLSHNAELLRHPDMRLLRKAVTALTYHAARGGGAITELVASRNWPLALDEVCVRCAAARGDVSPSLCFASVCCGWWWLWRRLLVVVVACQPS
jgi:hypothetical protein